MKLLFLLSKENVELAKEEVYSLVPSRAKKDVSNIVVLTPSKKVSITRLIARFGLTKSVHQLLFSCPAKKLSGKMESFRWQNVVKRDFVVRTHYLKSIKQEHAKTVKKPYFSEKYLAKYVWRGLKNPKVNVRHPNSVITLFFFKGTAHCTLFLAENKDKFHERRAHLRPFHYSGSLHPKIARAMINILGVSQKEVIIDPFCGAGGILLEAGLMGMPVRGYDLHWRMVEGCGKNLRHYHIKNFDIMRKDALQLNQKLDYVVTDLPYGLNSTIQEDDRKISIKQQRKEVSDVESFYIKFLVKLRPLLRKKAVIVFPDFVSYKKLLKKAGFEIENEFSVYIHRTLTRKIVKIH